MTNWIFSFIDQFGYLAVAAAILIENIFPPIPSEVILSFSGFLTHQTKMNSSELIIAATIGATLGALILYWIGSLFTKKRLEQFLEQPFFQKMGFKKSDVQRSITWFEKRGDQAVFYGRFIPVIRSLISIPAGIAKLKMTKFILYTTLGSLIWNSILIGLGAYMGKNWQLVVTIFEEYSLIACLLLLAFGIYLSYQWYNKRIKK